MESVEGRMQTICFCEGQVAELKPAGKQKKLESCSLAVLCILVGGGVSSVAHGRMILIKKPTLRDYLGPSLALCGATAVPCI